MLETGMAPEKVHRIPIGIDVETFPLRSPDGVASARRAFELPESAFVVGSFQKDGVGWGEGLEPKLIKGPDVLLAVAERLQRARSRARVPADRARRAGTSGRASSGSGSRTGTRSSTTSTRSRRAYEAIDVCVVASRDEGGPRAVLEAMATGVPLVTTRVGPGRRSRRARRERLDGRRRGRRGAGRLRSCTSPRRARTSSSACCDVRAARRPRRTRTRRCGRVGARSSTASSPWATTA